MGSSLLYGNADLDPRTQISPKDPIPRNLVICMKQLLLKYLVPSWGYVGVESVGSPLLNRCIQSSWIRSNIKDPAESAHEPNDWGLFIDALKLSLKAVLLNNGNELPSIPVAHAVYMKETYHNLKQLLEMINYTKYGWKICADLKVMSLLMGLQLGYTKYCCFLCLWDSRAIAFHYIKRDWPQRASFKPGEMNVKHPLLAEPNKIIIPPLYIKLGLVKNLVKAMDKNGPAFKYLREKIPLLSVTKIKEGVFVGTQIKQVFRDSKFETSSK
ncbi:hypothetical protein AVEN_150878-1 [Araneus ventricosus]|uniref:Uncharacterized protein n=1 Tax=Araneus ventricosus TaxID=182803 RepID=A0A4Y2C8M8_ARAVE|nr:hypothetical protein AVEN_150878-1 [Araneus ventricosus]